MGETDWTTHFEKTQGRESTPYNSTITFLQKLADETGLGKLIPIGESPRGRPLYCFAASLTQNFDPRKTAESGHLTVLIQNGIHGGEVEGKDASLLLLREILLTRERQDLLEGVTLLVVPVFNVDGHERLSPHNRPNQLGPDRMGWRTTAQNLDLNRDYAKADAPEMRALLSLFNTWLPDFIIDNHTTNGADYQYHVTYSVETHENISSGLAGWARNTLLPGVTGEVEARGFLTAPYVQLRTGRLEDGFADPPSLPRYSTGYAAAQNRLCFLVEAHSLKPYPNRVASTLAMNAAVLRCLSENRHDLKTLNEAADALAIHEFGEERRPFPLRVEESPEPVPFSFKGFVSEWEYSPVTGAHVRRYLEEPDTFVVPYFAGSAVRESVRPPAAYFVPAELESILDRLRLHGVAMRQAEEEKWLVELYEWEDTQFAGSSYEGRQMVHGRVKARQEWQWIGPHGYLVPVAQRRARLIIHLLEPHGPDSFFRWGFLNAFLERKEYAEDFVFEPIARKMLAGNPRLKTEFEERLQDDAFRRNPSARLDFLYRRSPYFDRREETYPVLRLLKRNTARSETTAPGPGPFK